MKFHQLPAIEEACNQAECACDELPAEAGDELMDAINDLLDEVADRIDRLRDEALDATGLDWSEMEGSAVPCEPADDHQHPVAG
jgi:hypothetical protein